MSNVALSERFTDNFFNLHFDQALNEVIEVLVGPTSTKKLKEVIDLIDFYSLRSSIYHNGVASIAKRVNYTGGTSLSQAKDTTTQAFNALLKVTPSQGFNGSTRVDYMVENALVPARKYLFDMNNSLQEKKNSVIARLGNLESLEASLKLAKTEYINNSETLTQFEIEFKDELNKLMDELNLQDLNEKKAMIGDPEKDDVLLDQDKFVTKDELIKIITDMFEGIPNENKVSHSFLGKSSSFEVKGTDVYDFIKSKYSETYSDLTQFVNDLIDMALISPKNVQDFQISTRSRYEWTDKALVITGKQELPSKSKKGSTILGSSLFSSNSNNNETEEVNRVEKFKKLKNLAEDSTEKYEVAVAVYDEALLSFEVLMFDTLIKLEQSYKNLQLSVRDLCGRFEFYMGQNDEVTKKLQDINAGGESDSRILLGVSTLKSKFIANTQIFEPYNSESYLRTIFGVKLINVQDIYPDEGSVIIATVLKEIASLSVEDQVKVWTKRLDSLDDFKEVLTVRNKINELPKTAESTEELVEQLDNVFNTMNLENLGLVLRRYLSELPESLIDTSTITILNDAFKESFDIDLEYVRSFYDVETAENQSEKVSKSTLNAILSHIFKLRNEIVVEAEKKELVEKVGLNLIHFILKPSPSTPYFLEDEYTKVLMEKIIESMEKV